MAVLFWLLPCYSFFSHFFKWFVAPQLWNLYHQQRKYNSFLLVGETVKRLVELESLRRPSENQILTPLWMGRWKYRTHKIFLFQRRTLLHIPQSFRTGWLLQKQLMAQEVITVFDQMVKQSLSYIPCQLLTYLLIKIFMQVKGYL